ncbi:MAG: GNAT family N-acetyltransferase [Alphaproteobacteria bacterium]|nr:GNAT family N-acetyltransferase [Alphaproteobacteria bacterium]
MRVECVDPKDLTPGDIACWRRLIVNQPVLTSPYLTPEWAQVIDRHRHDARIAVFRDASSRVLGFLPVQRPNAVAAMPIGSPLCDYQALIGPAEATFDLSRAAHALDVGRIDFTSALKDTALGAHLHTSDAGHLIRFEDGWDAYCDERQRTGSKIIARTRKKLSRLSRDYPGAVAFEPFSKDGGALDQLLTWKRQQMLRTGVKDIFEHAWVGSVIRDTFETPATSSFGGALFVLRVREAPVAILYCLQARATLHAWFVAHDPTFAEHSPGLVVIAETIRHAADLGYHELDLGPGEYQFKESFANASRPVGAGFIGRRGLSTAYRAAQFQIRSIVEILPVGRARGWPAKAMRRLDVARGLDVARSQPAA